MSEKTKNKYNQKSIYVPDKHLDFWDELSSEAELQEIGVGSHVCRELKKLRNIIKKMRGEQ